MDVLKIVNIGFGIACMMEAALVGVAFYVCGWEPKKNIAKNCGEKEVARSALGKVHGRRTAGDGGGKAEDGGNVSCVRTI